EYSHLSDHNNIDWIVSKSNELVDYLKTKFDTVDQSLSDFECSVKNSDKDSMDLKSTKNALDQHKEVLSHFTSVESDTYDVLEEGRQLIKDTRFDRAYGEYFYERIEVTVIRITTIKENINREHQRLFDLYLILRRQHLERMNGWLLRAESRISLDDVIEPTYKRVQQQVWEHQAFQDELSNYSMANMVLDMDDLDQPALDENIRDCVKVLNERWAVVWNWAEEWKEKLNQALIDWQNLREEEAPLLSWLSSKEQTFDLIGETDITNEEQVTMNLNLLETMEKEMESRQEERLDSLRETGEKLIKDAEYHDATAKGIRDQLQEAQNKVKRMGILMKEVRAWLYEAEQFIKLASLQEDPQKETEIQEKIEIECEEREKNKPKVDEVKRLEDLLSSEIDKKSNYYLKRVTKPFYERWNDASMALNRYRNEDYPFVKPNDCSLLFRYMTQIGINLEGKRDNSGSNELVDYLKTKFDTVDQSLSDFECSVKNSDKDSMDLKSTKNALDQHKEVLSHFTSVESDTYDVLEEGRQLIKDTRFDRAYGEYFYERIEVTVIRITTIKENINREHQRLFDLYLILRRQHLERMNGWLLRAESRISLDDVIEPTYKRVQQQVWEHQAFQDELSNYSMANMVLDMDDLDQPALDENIRDCVKVLNERWAVVWNWAEEWKEKLNQALIDWQNLREEEAPLLSWLSSKEQTFDLIGETDITNEEQVTMNLNLLETMEKEMESRQEERLDSLRETGEKLIKDAEYHDATAKGIRDQLQEAQNKVKRMGILMKEVRAWLYEAEQFIKLASLQEDPQKETEIQEKIEIECEEREKNQPKVDEVKRLEDLLSSEIDKKSNYYLKRVTKPFYKRWDDASMALNRYRNEDYPFVNPKDCFLVKCLKKALVVN
ncbi:unnamed protein product, partial [Porites evermanni]